MGAVDNFDHLTAQNAGLRGIRRGGHQALEHWLLRTVLVNCYLISLHSEVLEPRVLSFRSQREFREQLIEALLRKANRPCTSSVISQKRRISIISQSCTNTPLNRHTQMKMQRIGLCVACKGLRAGDRPRKRTALATIAINMGRESKRSRSLYGCKECDVHLCNNNTCFSRFHQEM